MAGALSGSDTKTNDKPMGSGGQHDIALINIAGGAVDNPDLDLLGGQTLQGRPDRLDAALDIRLEDDVQFLDLAGTNLVVEIIQVHRFRSAGRFLLRFRAAPGEDDLGVALIRYRHQVIAHAGNIVQT